MVRAFGLALMALAVLAFALPAEARRVARPIIKANTKVKNPFSNSGGFSQTRARRWGNYRKSGSSRRYAKTRIFWRGRRRHIQPSQGRLHPNNFQRLGRQPARRFNTPPPREGRSSRRDRRSRRWRGR